MEPNKWKKNLIWFQIYNKRLSCITPFQAEINHLMIYLHELTQISVLLHGWETHLNCLWGKEDLLTLTAWVLSSQGSQSILFSWEEHHLRVYVELLTQVRYKWLYYTHTWVNIDMHYWCWHSTAVFYPPPGASIFLFCNYFILKSCNMLHYVLLFKFNI